MANQYEQFSVASPYQLQQQELDRRQKMAEILQQQAFEPVQAGSYQGIQARISPVQGLAKVLQMYLANENQKDLVTQQKALGEKYQADTSSDIQRLIKGLQGQAGSPEVKQEPTAADFQDNPNLAPTFAEMQPDQQKAFTTPAVQTRAAGMLDPSLISEFKTPGMQQQAMNMYMAQLAPKAPLVLKEGDVAFNPTTGAEMFKANAKSPFGSIDPSKYTPESLQSFTDSGGKNVHLLRALVDAEKGLAPLNQKDYTPDSWRTATLDGKIDRTKLIPFVEGPPSLAGYNLYSSQEKAAGRIPKSYERFQTDQQIAGRQQTPPRERYVYDAARGGRVNLDTGNFEPITQGGQAIGVKDRALPTGEVEKITAIDNSLGNQKRLAETFQDKFGGYSLKAGGELANVLGGKFGGQNQAQAEWWASHEANDNVARNALFGASLTAGEQKAWDKTTINPGMSPSMIKSRMTERQELIDAKRNTTIGNLDKAGYDVKSFKEKSDFYNKPAGKVTTAQEIQDVATKTGKSVSQVMQDAIAKGYKVQ
jgi:hypothetical protein